MPLSPQACYSYKQRQNLNTAGSQDRKKSTICETPWSWALEMSLLLQDGQVKVILSEQVHWAEYLPRFEEQGSLRRRESRRNSAGRPDCVGLEAEIEAEKSEGLQ